MSILSLIIIIPILTIIGILFTKNQKGARMTAAIGMALQLITVAAITIFFYRLRHAGITDHYLFVSDMVWFKSLNIHFAIGLDNISAWMICLTAVVVFAGIFASWEMELLSREFFISLILLSTGVFGFFLSIDLFTMFLFYELAVIPMYLLIGIWGSGPKEYAAMKLTLMLMGGSALLVVGLLGLYFNSSINGHLTFNIVELSKMQYPVAIQRFFFPFLFVGFGILGALFPLHTWSPDGHSSAPTAVSMLHAGVLMKLGGYGCFRVAMYLLPQAAHEMSWIFLILTTISIVYGAFGAIWQKDLKYINAYSSVSHCGMVIFALLMMNQTSMDGAVIQMISHGLMTALFFALIGMIYSRTHTRNITEMGGLMNVIPFLAVGYLLAGLASLGLPGFSGFVAEMTIFVGSFQHQDLFHRVCTIVACMSIVITAVYILRVVAILLLGEVKHEEHRDIKDAHWFERLSIFALIIPIVVIGISPLFLSNTIIDGLKPILDKLMAVL